MNIEYLRPVGVALLLSLAITSRGQTVQSNDLALVNATVYPTPQANALERAVVIVRDGKIAAVRTAGDVPSGVHTIDCAGRFITAGFWNSHVHFTEDVWNDARSAPATGLQAHLATMLNRLGFTTVFDLGSNPGSTFALKRRIESGEIAGPRILTTAGNIFPENGIPTYLPPGAASALKPFEAATPADATRLARMQIGLGADALKLFTGGIVGRGRIVPMPTEVVRAAVEVAHAAGKPVFAHPSNHEGTGNALAGGVDILAHTIPIERDGFTADELRRMTEHHVGLIPTLTLWEVEAAKGGTSAEDGHRFASAGARELNAYFKAGGPILFGTDVGYTQHYDTTEEFALMNEGGMAWRDILASLTTAPAAFFKDETRGRIEAGQRADLVVLDADPARDVRNFARVAIVIRDGRVIVQR